MAKAPSYGKGDQRNSRRYNNGDYEASASINFRSQVLRLRNASDAGSIRSAVGGLREAVLDAARADIVLDDALLGMAASQCARHKQADLLGLLCAQAVFRLASCSGRSVAELASAAAKLDRVESGFARSVAAYCTSPPYGAFISIRDIAMVAAALRAFVDIDHTAALCGLGEAAMSLLNDSLSQRDLADVLHQLAQLLFTKCGTWSFSPQRQRVHEVLCLALHHFKRRLHRASAMDVAMVAGVIAGLWPLLERERETMLRPCLSDIAQLARFRRTEFNPQDLSNIAMAFAKMGLANSDIADVLDEQTNGQLAKFSNKDVALVLCAAARLPQWSSAPFAKTVASQLLYRDLTRFSPQDLCTSAQSLAKLRGLGGGSFQRIADEAFQRQLCAFTGNDKAILLWSLAKVRSKHSALLRIIVRGLAVENFNSIDRDLASGTIWALARIWQQLPDDQWQQSLFYALCSLCPWMGATTSELCRTAWAVGQLFSAHADIGIWCALLQSLSTLTPKSCSLHELCLLLHGLAACQVVCHVDYDFAASIIAEVGHRILTGQEHLSYYDKQLLKESFAPNFWQVPSEFYEMLMPRAAASERRRFQSFDEFNDFEEEVGTFASNDFPQNAADSVPMAVLNIRHPSKCEEAVMDIRQPSKCDHGHSSGHAADGSKSLSIGSAWKDDIPGDGYGVVQVCEVVKCPPEGCGQACCKLIQALDLMIGASKKDCTTRPDSDAEDEVRPSNHGDVQKHSIKTKNTFIHVQCSHSDSDAEDCEVCKMTRSQSCDDITQRSHIASSSLPCKTEDGFDETAHTKSTLIEFQ